MNNFSTKPILLLGIGIFFWALGATFAYLFQYIFRNVLFLIGGIAPLVNLLLNEILYLSVFVGLFFCLLQLLKSGKTNLSLLFYWSIGLVIFGQILQFLAPMFMSRINDESFWVNSSAYSELYGINIVAPVISGIFNLSQYGVLGWLVYKNRNLIIKTEASNSEINDIGQPDSRDSR